MPASDVDVLIVGAGLSGIGAAVHLQRDRPGATYEIHESRASIGGTWDLFRYPGIRSDSDMYTLGYSFKPWTDPKSIADGPSILEYVRATAREHDVERHIRLSRRVVAAEFSSESARWRVESEITDGPRAGERVETSARFLFFCSGYYDYEQGFSPGFEGAGSFGGEIVHPQRWPEDLDWSGKRVVVIGSGATAVTLVPAMAADAAHVTMLQRSPSYVVALPGADPIANFLNRHLPARIAYPIIRWKNVLTTMASFQLSRRRPGLMRRFFRKGVERQLRDTSNIDVDFNPAYDPWDQRVCLVPDGDLFKSINKGDASIVTDRIERFDETGIALESGEHLDADVIVTATGLNLLALGGAELAVDGEPVSLPDKLAYKSMMLSGVPNMALSIGYTNASWTLKCDLTCEFVCRLLNHMEANGYDACTPVNDDPDLATEPFIDFSSGYVQRSIADFPKQGERMPWRLHQNYLRDIVVLRRGELEDGAMRFTRAGTPVTPAAAGPAATALTA